MSQDFSKGMQAYHFLSVHLKFEVKIPIDGTKPPSKNPDDLTSANNKVSKSVDIGVSEPNMFLLSALPRRVN